MLLVVYAVGLYVDPKATKRLLNKEQADISGRSGLPDQAVFDGESCCQLAESQHTLFSTQLNCLSAGLVKSNDVEKSLRMVISFGGVNQKNFWSALQERLEPPMKQVSAPLLP